MSLSSKSARPRAAHESTEVNAVNYLAADMPTVGPTSRRYAAGPNQSPEQAADMFEMPLFPGYVKAVHAPAVRSPRQTPSYAMGSQSRDIAALVRQQAEFSHYIQEQSKHAQSEIEGLQQQLVKQARQHQTELQQMSQAWRRQFTALTQATAAQETVAPSIEALEDKPNVESERRQANTPARASRRRTVLSRISTTYRVPHRPQVRWVETVISAVPTFLWLFVLGMGIAGISAIALSSSGLAPASLWPSMGPYINVAIPIIFIVGLLSLSITAVWDSFR